MAILTLVTRTLWYYCSVLEATNGHDKCSQCFGAEFDMVGSEALPNPVINSVTVSQENSGVEVSLLHFVKAKVELYVLVYVTLECNFRL